MSRNWHRLHWVFGLWLVGSYHVMHTLQAQDPAVLLQEGKRLLRSASFEQAGDYFGGLLRQLPTGDALLPAVSLYYGIARYHSAQYDEATQVFGTLSRQYPEWESDQVRYWQGMCYFQKGDTYQSMKALSAVKKKALAGDVISAKQRLFKRIAKDSTLFELYRVHRKDSVLQAYMFGWLMASASPGQEARFKEFHMQGRWEKEIQTIFSRAAIYKKRYRVAVLLPLMLSKDKQRIISPFSKELYMGIRMAHEEMQRRGISIDLQAYDTRASREGAQGILEKTALQDVDLIIGPLYEDAVEVIAAFSKKHGIHMINPLSKNPQVTEGHPFSLLFHAHYRTQNALAADHVTTQMKNQRAAIFYENTSRSRTIAQDYARRMRESGFDIVTEQALFPDEATSIREWLSETREIPYEPEDDEDAVPDSIVIEWIIPQGYIGHIFVASTDPSFLAYTVSAVEERPDTIPILTQAHWLDHKAFDLEQLERLGVIFVSGLYVDRSNRAFQDMYLSRYGQIPSGTAAIGYELMYTMGALLHRYGKNFEHAFKSHMSIQGHLSKGLKYGMHQDNQYPSLLQLREGAVIQVSADASTTEK